MTLRRHQVAEAARRKLFARGFRAECQAAADLAERTGALLRREALYLSLASKAGLVSAGFERVAGEAHARVASRSLSRRRTGQRTDGENWSENSRRPGLPQK